MQTLIIIRFSLDITNGFGKLTEGLYEKERMDLRFELFESICLPSLLAQTVKDGLTVVILISTNMPKTYLDRLNTITAHHDFIYIMPIKPSVDFSKNKHFRKFIRPDTRKLCTMKLDDDDAISPVLCETVLRHAASCNKMTLISFPNGCCFNYDNKTVSACSFKLVACGLTLVSDVNEEFNVYNRDYATLNHSGMGKIFDEAKPMYLISNHSSNHSMRGQWMKPGESDDEIMKTFWFIKN